MKKLLVLLSLVMPFYLFSQNVNDYKYVIVPAKFNFQVNKDDYRLNTLTKLVFEKYGFIAFLSSDTIPEEILDKKCKILYANVEKKKSFLNSKLRIVLNDCKETIIYATKYGVSRDKEYNLAYSQALREASKSFDSLNYKYNGNNKIETTVLATEKRTLPKEAVVLNENFETPKLTETDEITTDVFFFAQPIANGFQVVNSEPKVIMLLFNTSQKDVFIAKRERSQGVVIFKNNEWFFEYYDNGKLVSEVIKLKF